MAGWIVISVIAPVIGAPIIITGAIVAGIVAVIAVTARVVATSNVHIGAAIANADIDAGLGAGRLSYHQGQ